MQPAVLRTPQPERTLFYVNPPPHTSGRLSNVEQIGMSRAACAEDEHMLGRIAACAKDRILPIVDCRPRSSATANFAAGLLRLVWFSLHMKCSLYFWLPAYSRGVGKRWSRVTSVQLVRMQPVLRRCDPCGVSIVDDLHHDGTGGDGDDCDACRLRLRELSELSAGVLRYRKHSRESFWCRSTVLRSPRVSVTKVPVG